MEQKSNRMVWVGVSLSLCAVGILLLISALLWLCGYGCCNGNTSTSCGSLFFSNVQNCPKGSWEKKGEREKFSIYFAIDD